MTRVNKAPETSLLTVELERNRSRSEVIDLNKNS